MAEQPKIPSLDGLNELARRDGVDIKPTLLRVVTDLYVQKPVHSVEEERHYTELAMRLIDKVDAATRTIIARRLANYPRSPQPVVERLWHERAQRGEVEPDAAPTLSSTPAPASVRPPTPAAKPFTAEATSSASPVELSELFLAADARERRLILLHLDLSSFPAAASVAPQLAQDAIRRLEMAALSHSSDSFAQDIERTLGIAKSYARRLIDDPSGEPLLVLAMALGMPADVLQRVLLCLNSAISHSVLRVYELSTLYSEIDRQSALRLIGIWQQQQQQQQQKQQPAHRPQHYDDGQVERSLPARPTIRWEEHAQRRNDGTS